MNSIELGNHFAYKVFTVLIVGRVNLLSKCVFFIFVSFFLFLNVKIDWLLREEENNQQQFIDLLYFFGCCVNHFCCVLCQKSNKPM